MNQYGKPYRFIDQPSRTPILQPMFVISYRTNVSISYRNGTKRAIPSIPTHGTLRYRYAKHPLPGGTDHLTLSGDTRSISGGNDQIRTIIDLYRLVRSDFDCYQLVPLKSAVGDRFRPLAVDFDHRRSISVVDDRFRLSAIDFVRQRSIEGEIARQRSIEEEKGKKKKRKRRNMKRRRGTSRRPCAHAAREPSPPAGDFCPRTGRETEATEKEEEGEEKPGVRHCSSPVQSVPRGRFLLPVRKKKREKKNLEFDTALHPCNLSPVGDFFSPHGEKKRLLMWYAYVYRSVPVYRTIPS
ncbi:hypothetical protein BHE74_00015307 [Ensete ventricosum]|nr:hypothetical protein GW17_00022219 [Ensete ventricosum]RWW76589.1 hypothetical protein BHE74_00015307 [Ensete ventricosum]RZR93217.1 hypothetical protein BHM03_00021659 [Ensete ventricosum]